VQIRPFSNITVYDEGSFEQHSISVRSSISLYLELGIVLIQWCLAIENKSQLQTVLIKFKLNIAAKKRCFKKMLFVEMKNVWFKLKV
jgi:hypothetical protein